MIKMYVGILIFVDLFYNGCWVVLRGEINAINKNINKKIMQSLKQ